MERPLTSNVLFPTVPKYEKKAHIPIRSIAYKKNLAAKDVEVKKEMLSTMGKFSTSPLWPAGVTSPTRVSTNHGSKPDSDIYQPFMSYTFHRISLGSPKETPRKFQSSLLPNVKPPRIPQPPSRNTLFNYSEHHTHLQRSKTKECLGAVTAQEDYFKLLVDENRGTFKVEDYEGADEFYTDDEIRTRIYNQGFRDPAYFSKRLEFVDMRVPNEQSIRDEYRFKMPAIISTMENNNTLATHVLGGAVNNVTFVESTATAAEEQLRGIQAEKKHIQAEIEAIKKKFELEVQNITANFSKKFEELQSTIKEDFIANQNDNFK